MTLTEPNTGGGPVKSSSWSMEAGHKTLANSSTSKKSNKALAVTFLPTQLREDEEVNEELARRKPLLQQKRSMPARQLSQSESFTREKRSVQHKQSTVSVHLQAPMQYVPKSPINMS